MRVLPHTVLGAEVILESYAEVYSNQFMTGNSPLQLVQWSTVPNNNNNNKISIWYPSLITRNSSRARQPLSRVNVTELLRRLLVKIENICVFKIYYNKKHGNVFKNWLCPSFLLLPKKSELPKLWAFWPPPRPVRLCAWMILINWFFAWAKNVENLHSGVHFFPDSIQYYSIQY